MSASTPPSQRATVKRLSKRAAYDATTVHAIVDEALVCHVGFIVDGQPVVIPTAHGRVGDRLYIHGSPASRMLRNLVGGLDVCVTITLVDGVVMARSAFHHSLNYRSVVIFGAATIVDDPTEKLAALRAFTEHVVPGRYDDVRSPSDAELAGTWVLSLSLAEASAKVRVGPPVDDPADMDRAVWAGVVPLSLEAGVPVPDPQLAEGIALPTHAADYTRARKRQPSP